MALALARIFSKVQSGVIGNGNLLDDVVIPDPAYNKNNVIGVRDRDQPLRNQGWG